MGTAGSEESEPLCLGAFPESSLPDSSMVSFLMLKQSHFRFYMDDTSPQSAGPVAAEDVGLTSVQVNGEFLLRLQTVCVSAAAQAARRLEVRPAGGAWTQESSAEGNAPLVMEDSSFFLDPTTISAARLTTPTSGVFVSGQARDVVSETDVTSFGVNGFSEDVFKIRVAGGIASLGATYELRLTNGGAPYESYAAIPSLTVSDVVSPSVMDVKANQRFGDRRPLAKLEFWRDGEWQDLSERLVFPLRLYHRLRAASTAELLLDNSDGGLARGNLASPYNYDASSTYDPLLDENRKIRIQQGWEIHPNLLRGRPYDCSPAPVASYADPQGGKLTDGHFGAWVGWSPEAGQPVVITCTLAAPAKIKGAAISALSQTNSGIYLPSSAAAFLHTSSGAVGPLALAGAHLADDPGGKDKRLLGLDWEVEGVEAISFYLYAQPGMMAAVDEIAAYDASTSWDWYRPTFTGLLGDEIAFSAGERGSVRLGQVRDLSKRLADCFVENFRHYRNQMVEQILEDILVNSYYGLELGEEEYRLEVTSFSLPKWTEQNATALDGCGQLAQMVGFVFEADTEGRYVFRDLEWEAQSGDETYLPEQDLLGWQPTVSGLDLRNKVTIRSRDARQKDIAVTVVDEDSIERYGARLFTLYEPTMRTAPLARQLGRAILRDYSWVHPAGAGEVAGDVFLRPGDIVSVVESAAAFSRNEELYRIEAISGLQTGQRFGDHTMVLELRGYRPRVPDAVTSLTAAPLGGGVRLSWVNLEEARVSHYGAFMAESLGGVYSLVSSVAQSPAMISSLSNGEEYWFKVAAFTYDGRRGDFAGPINCTPSSGGAATLAEEAYRPRSLSAWMGAMFHRPEMRWYPGSLGSERGALFNIYRAEGSPTGTWRNVGTKDKGDQETLFWRDYGTIPASTSLYYRVTYWNKSGFESFPSSWAEVPN